MVTYQPPKSVDSSAPTSAAWNPAQVAKVLRHPIHVRLYSAAPYLADLYRSDLEWRIQHPSQFGSTAFSRPLLIRKFRKNYFIPGSSQDLIYHASCVAAFHEQVPGCLPEDQDVFDYCPPLRSEMRQNLCGDFSVMLAYWRRLNAETSRRLQQDFTHVLHADISDCFASVDTEVLDDLLSELGGNCDVLRGFQAIHQHWAQADCQGLPLTGSSHLLLKIYLKKVDAQLKAAGVPFIRLQDDFRLFGRSKRELASHREELQKALLSRGMRLNTTKTRMVSRGPRPSGASPFSWADLRRTFSHGILCPLLSDGLSFRLFRPVSLRLLPLFCGHTCWSA